jgi:DNA-binding transcriptional MerR regulator
MQIGEVSRRSGLPVSAIRYYESAGVLPVAARRSGKRIYDQAALDRLALIETAKACGCTLAEIRNLLRNQASLSQRWEHLAESRLEKLDRLEQEIRRMRRILRSMLACRCQTPEECGRRSRQSDANS